jgi:hypothetical protein
MTEPNLNPPPVPPPHFSSGYFRDATAANARPLGRGLVGHVRVVAGLMIGLGVLEVCLALLFVLFGLASFALPRESGANPEMLAALYGSMAVVTASCGALRIGAGLYNLRFRRRQLGIAALGFGLIAVFTGFCAPTAIGLAVYGLIVYLNEPVVAAFDLGQSGKTAGEIQAAFPPGT